MSSRPESPLPQRPSSTPERTPEDQIRRYRAYIKANENTDPDCQWLQMFFADSVPVCTPEGRVHFRIYSSRDGMESLRKDDIGPDVLALKDKLKLRAGQAKAVILSYNHVWNIGSEFVEILGSVFHIDPSFLCHHLNYPGCAELEKDYIPEKAAERIRRRRSPVTLEPLASETSRTAFQTGRQRNYMSAWLHQDAAVVFVRRSRSLVDSPWSMLTYLHELNQSPLTKSSDWIQFLLPYIYLLLKDYHSQIARWVEPRVLGREPDSAGLEFRSMLELQMELHGFRTYLSNFITAHRKGSDSIPQVQVLLGDSDQLVLRLERSIKTYTQLHKNQILNEQLQETRESKQASISVNRLTKLAFVFIPLNFVCALFSANLLILGDGVSLWVFAVAAMVAVILTILPVSRSIITYVKGAKPFFLHLWRAGHLFWHSPRADVYYGLFCLSHDEDVYRTLCYRCDWFRLSSFRSATCLWDPTFEFIPNPGSEEHEMWKRRVQTIYDLVYDLNGHQRRLWDSWPGFSPKKKSQPSPSA